MVSLNVKNDLCLLRWDFKWQSKPFPSRVKSIIRVTKMRAEIVCWMSAGWLRCSYIQPHSRKVCLKTKQPIYLQKCNLPNVVWVTLAGPETEGQLWQVHKMLPFIRPSVQFWSKSQFQFPAEGTGEYGEREKNPKSCRFFVKVLSWICQKYRRMSFKMKRFLISFMFKDEIDFSKHGKRVGDTLQFGRTVQGCRPCLCCKITKGSTQLRWSQLHWGLQSPNKCSSTFTWEALTARKNCSCSGGLQNWKGSLI